MLLSICIMRYFDSTYFDLERLSSAHWTEGLITLSGRWIQPIQQQGRRIPSLSSETTRLTCSSLVFCCLTVIAQQIHSLRASGVRLCQASRAAGESVSAFFKSVGNACTVPPASASLIMLLIIVQATYRAKRAIAHPDLFDILTGMYRNYTAEQYRARLGFPTDYTVDAMLCYGTLYEDRVLAQLIEVMQALKLDAALNDLPHPFLRFGKELVIDDKKIWFAIGYGGAWLSEYIHWACLFGSKKNLLLGSCGGLKPGMKQGDFIVPESSYGEESSVKIYNRESNTQYPDKELSKRIASKLGEDGTKVWRGPMVTCQAMIGETLEDVRDWSNNGYFGVEMEASTVFAVSNHFNVPCAASLYIGDNLIEDHTNLSDEYTAEADTRKQNQLKQIRVALSELVH